MSTPQASNKPSLNISNSLLSKKLVAFPKQFVQFNPKIRQNAQLTSNKKTSIANSNQSSQQQQQNNESKQKEEKNPYILNNSKKLFDVSFKPSVKGLFQVTLNDKADNNNLKSTEQQKDSMEIENHSNEISKKRSPSKDNINIFVKKFKTLTDEGSEEKMNTFSNPYSQENILSLNDTGTTTYMSSNEYDSNHSQRNNMSQSDASYTIPQSFINDEAEYSDDECNVDEIQEFFVQHTGKLASSLEELAGEMEECKDSLDELSVKLLMINNEILLMNNPMIHDEKTKNVDKIIQRFYEE